jgi:hypothetical protein
MHHQKIICRKGAHALRRSVSWKEILFPAEMFLLTEINSGVDQPRHKTALQFGNITRRLSSLRFVARRLIVTAVPELSTVQG